MSGALQTEESFVSKTGPIGPRRYSLRNSCRFQTSWFERTWRVLVFLAVAIPQTVVLMCFSDVLLLPGVESLGTKLIGSLTGLPSLYTGLVIVVLSIISMAALYVLGWPVWSNVDEAEIEDDGKERPARTSLSWLQLSTGFIVFGILTLGCVLYSLMWPFWSRITVMCLSMALLLLVNSWRKNFRVFDKFQVWCPDNPTKAALAKELVEKRCFVQHIFVCVLLTCILLGGASACHFIGHPEDVSWASYRQSHVNACLGVDALRHRPCVYKPVFEALAKPLEEKSGDGTKLEFIKDCESPSQSDLVKNKPEMFKKVTAVCQRSEAVFFTLWLTQYLYIIACPFAVVVSIWELHFDSSLGEHKAHGVPDPYRIRNTVVMLISLSICVVFFVGLLTATSGANVNLLNGVVSVGFAGFALSLAWVAWNASRIYEILDAEAMRGSIVMSRRLSEVEFEPAAEDEAPQTELHGEEMNQLKWLQGRAEYLRHFLDNEWVQALMVMSLLVPLIYFLELVRRRIKEYKRKKSPNSEKNEAEDNLFSRVSDIFLEMLEGASPIRRGGAPTRTTSVGAVEKDVKHPAQGWNFCSVFIKVCLLCELYFSIQVGSKFTFVFLSYMIELLEPLALGYIISLVFVIGFVMFMLPIVPGMAVYLFIGILVPKAIVDRNLAAGHDDEDEFVLFVAGAVAAILVALLLKLVACVGQYYIGYCLGRNIHIQKQFNVDGKLMRAAASILQGRAKICYCFGKVIVLVGGPDWPTSVVCGIIKANVCSMLLFTLPVTVVQVPCIMSGAYMIKVTPNEQSDDSSLRNLWSLIAAGLQGLSTLGAMYAGQMAYNEDESLSEPPTDVDERKTYDAVQKLREEEKQFLENYDKVLRDTPYYRPCAREGGLLRAFGARWVIILALCMTYASSAVLAGDGLAFENFELSSKISDPIDNFGLGGDVRNVVKAPFGWAVLATFSVGVLLHLLFVEAKTWEAKNLPLTSNEDAAKEPLIN